MSMSFIKSFKKDVDKMEGVSTDGSPPRYWYHSGNYVMNRILSGSFTNFLPQGRITAICGPSSAGKSFIVGNALREAQKQGAFLLVLDSEGALDDQWMSNMGVDVNDNYMYISVNTIPQVIKIISRFIKDYKSEYGSSAEAPKIVIAIDSLDNLQTANEAEVYAKGEQVGDQGQKPKQIKSMLMAFMNDVKAYNISMIVTKQVYAAGREQLMKGEGAWVVNDSMRYPCSQIVVVSRLKLKDDADTKSITGIRMKVEGFKTRFTKPFQTVTIEVPYDTGMDPYSGLFEVALGLGVIVKPSVGWYTLAGSDKKWREREFPSYAEEVLRLCDAMGEVSLEAQLDAYDEITEHEPVKRAPVEILNEEA